MLANKIVSYIAFGSLLTTAALLAIKKIGNRALLNLQQCLRIMRQIKCLTLESDLKIAQKSAQIKTNQIDQLIGLQSFHKLNEGLFDKCYKQHYTKTLTKHKISQQLFQQSLKELQPHHVEISRYFTEIAAMRTRTISGEGPDLNIPYQAYNLCNKQQLLELQHLKFAQCADIIIRAVKAQLKNKNSYFFSNQKYFEQALETVDLFDFAQQFLISKGFQSDWGSPNEIYIKLRQIRKREDIIFRQKDDQMKRFHASVLKRIAEHAQHLTTQRVSQLMRIGLLQQFKMSLIDELDQQLTVYNNQNPSNHNDNIQ